MFGLSFSKDVENFAIELATDFAKLCPVDHMADGQPAVLARAIDELGTRAQAFQRSKRLGLYGKAKFGTEFKLKLKELGYAPQFAQELTHSLLIRISGA
jgi:hypothetical protein